MHAWVLLVLVYTLALRNVEAATTPTCSLIVGAKPRSGTIESVVNGGTPPFTYAWSYNNTRIASSQDISFVQGGEYTLQVTDNLGCTANSSVIVAGEIKVTTYFLSSACPVDNTQDTTALSAVGNGGHGALNYKWTTDDGTPVSLTSAVAQVSGGSYYVDVTDDFGSYGHAFIQFGQQLKAPIIKMDGSQLVSAVVGGEPPYNYQWTFQDTMQTGNIIALPQTISNLSWTAHRKCGEYSLRVTDQNKCSQSSSITVTSDCTFANCSYTYVAVESDTCDYISTKFGLSSSQFIALNPSINCDQTIGGNNLCVYHSQFTSVPCATNYSVIAGDTCFGIWNTAGLTQTQFYALNPDLNPDTDCQNLQIGQVVCIGNAQLNQTSCANIHFAVDGDTCYSVQQDFAIDSATFASLNPAIDCANLQIGFPMCVANAGYNAAYCSQSYRVQSNDTCDAIAGAYGISMLTLLKLNPYLDCANLNKSALVLCVAGTGNMTRLAALRYLASALSALNSSIQANFDAYALNPTEASQQLFLDSIFQATATSSGLALLQTLQADSEFVDLQNALATSRSGECSQLQRSALQAATSCMCNTSQPYLYCKALVTMELDALIAAIKNVTQYAQGKRSIVDQALHGLKQRQANDLKQQQSQDVKQTQAKQSKRFSVDVGSCSLDLPSSLSQPVCVSGSCCQSYGIFDVCLTAGGCLPSLSTMGVQASQVKVCKMDMNSNQNYLFSSGDRCLVADLPSKKFNEIINVNMYFELSICLDMGDLNDVLEKIGIDTCYRFKLVYYPIKQQLEITFDFSILGAVEFYAGITVQTGNSQARYCALDAYKCASWCTNPRDYISGHFSFSLCAFGLCYKTYRVWDKKDVPCDQGRFFKPPPVPTYDIIGYFGNWPIYSHQDQLVQDLKYPALMMTSINYAFAMPSYSRDYDAWYLDFSDAWADIGICPNGQSSAYCQDDDSYLGGIPMPNSCTASYTDKQGVTSYHATPNVAPYLGYMGSGHVEDACKTSCFNMGGPPPGRNIPCNTELFGIARPFWDTSKGSYAMGQYNYILRQIQPFNKKMTVALSIGGWYDSNYFTTLATPKYMDNFINSVASYMKIFGFDNIDIDWEYPGYEHGNQTNPDYSGPVPPDNGDGDATWDCAETSCLVDRSQDFERYMDFLRALKNTIQTNNAGYPPQLTITAPAGRTQISKFKNLTALCEVVDTVNIMTYDIHGTWDNMTNHQAPLYDNSPGLGGGVNSTVGTSVHSAVMAWIEGGCPARKINIGVPFYGRVFNYIGMQPPTPAPTPKPFSCSATRAVVSGDTCIKIQNASKITYWEFSDWNPSVNCSNLHLNDQLCVNATTPCAQRYQVVSGDSCSLIESKLSKPANTLVNLNPNLQCGALYVDQYLCVEYSNTSAKRDIRSELPGLYQYSPPQGTAVVGSSASAGIMTYAEVMNDPGFTIYWDDISKASYAWNGSTFVTFDDVRAVQAKMDYIKQWNLKGVIFWMLGQDSKNNELLSTIYSSLRPWSNTTL